MIVCLFHFLERSRKGKCRALKRKKKDITNVIKFVDSISQENCLDPQSETIYYGHKNLAYTRSLINIYRFPSSFKS